MSDAPSPLNPARVGDWIVKAVAYGGWCALGPVSKLTGQRCYHPDKWSGNREEFTPLSAVLLTGSEAAAKRIVEQFKSSHSLYEQESRAAFDRHKKRLGNILAAQSKSEDGAPPQSTQGSGG